MRSTFYGLDIANKGLFMAQRQIDVTSHNIANANTVGYTRQRFISAAVPSPGMNETFMPVDKGAVGGGVRTQSLDQIRDSFIDRQLRGENTRLSYWTTRSEGLYFVEDVFNGLDNASIGTSIQNFFNAWQEVSKNTSDGAIRVNLIENAKSLAAMINDNYNKLNDLMRQQDDMLVAQTKQINEITERIAALNDKIMDYEISGNAANDLRDQRNVLIDELSGLTDITYKEIPTGKLDMNGKEMGTLEIRIGGEILVDHKTARTLVCEQDQNNAVTSNYPPPVATEDMLHSIRFADTGVEVPFSGGTMKALIDLRDGSISDNQGIPYFIAQMDQLAKALVEQVNELHRQGWTMPYTDKHGVVHDSQTGLDFFDPANVTAATLSLSDDILYSEYNVAASSMEVTVDVSGDLETGNNENALAYGKLFLKSDVPVVGGFNKYYTSFVTEMASEVSHANKMVDQQDALVSSLTYQRDSISGVSLDEEMTNLVRFQHAYNAAARVITAMDEALDVLINRMGRVGL